MTFDSCASAGCHNYHDNAALYEDFLVAHAGEPAVRATPRVPGRTPHASLGERPGGSRTTRAALAADAPAGVAAATDLAAWEAAGHARAGVNCTACHTAQSAGTGAWLDRPGERECASCHGGEVAGFFGGRHGMRIARGLAPMTPSLARLPMKASAHDRELSCVSCHNAHAFDTRQASVDSCLGCHDDGHSREYVGSPHHRLWRLEQEGTAPAGSGVACATCHLPRETRRASGADGVVVVQHNQNANLRPSEKMTRTVCLACHGLGFSLDALADPGLVASNFRGRPLRSVAGIDMAVRRVTRPPTDLTERR
jgi:predicted CXXCH cytochrome family protein